MPHYECMLLYWSLPKKCLKPGWQARSKITVIPVSNAHWLNMESDLQSLFGLYSLAETSHPPPPIWAHIYDGAIGQPR
jgi:hypothetical protein